jgi:hypothetical protein
VSVFLRFCFVAWFFLAWPAGAVAEEEPDTDAAAMLVVPAAGARDVDGSTLVAEPDETRDEPPPSEDGDAENGAVAEEADLDDDLVAPAFPLLRYEMLWERSPFQLESIAPPEMSEGLAQRYALTGIAEINGEPIVFVMERATQNRVMVRSDAGEGDLSLVQVDVQAKYGESTATVRSGAEVGVVKFDATAGMPAIPQVGMPGMPVPGRPAQPGMPQAGVSQPVPGFPQPVMPGQPAPVQGVPGQPPVPGMPVPPVQPNGQVQAPQPGQPDMPPPRVIRRRALIPAAP